MNYKLELEAALAVLGSEPKPIYESFVYHKGSCYGIHHNEELAKWEASNIGGVFQTVVKNAAEIKLYNSTVNKIKNEHHSIWNEYLKMKYSEFNEKQYSLLYASAFNELWEENSDDIDTDEIEKRMEKYAVFARRYRKYS